MVLSKRASLTLKSSNFHPHGLPWSICASPHLPKRTCPTHKGLAQSAFGISCQLRSCRRQDSFLRMRACCSQAREEGSGSRVWLLTFTRAVVPNRPRTKLVENPISIHQKLACLAAPSPRAECHSPAINYFLRHFCPLTAPLGIPRLLDQSDASGIFQPGFGRDLAGTAGPQPAGMWNLPRMPRVLCAWSSVSCFYR